VTQEIPVQEVLHDRHRHFVAGHLGVVPEPSQERLGVLAYTERRRLAGQTGDEAAVHGVQLDAGQFSGWLPALSHGRLSGLSHGLSHARVSS
jgi:hypothetical protein